MKPFTPKMLEEPEYKPKTPISTSIEDDKLIEFDEMRGKFGLNRAQLLKQMVEYCLENYHYERDLE
jgi:hypothetical protein